MPTIENFYWILFENLLRPCGIDCWYYYPFGTKDHLSTDEFVRWRPRQEHHVLFHFDQEPIWNNDFGKPYDTGFGAGKSKIIKILANSEHSYAKKKICRQRGMLDWYFFYHGFASLDWFRDSEFIDQNTQPDKVFCSLNHQVTGSRAYRIGLTARLICQELTPLGDISFHADLHRCQAEAHSPDSLLTNYEKKLVQSAKFQQSALPLILDQIEINGDLSAHFGYQQYRLWQNSLVHLVNETVFYESKLHLTEKVFKPIVALRPFILAAAPGNLAYLRSYGFQTFGSWWDEGYDEIDDPDRRADAIVDIVAGLCAKSASERAKIFQQMQPVLQFNKQHFFGEFRERIVDELLCNFDTCMRIWNNGRVDGRELPLHPDLTSVKRMLLR